ncbi:MAG: diguanylate cyclase/phosphodiesterase (GGDEF & EAL domains) with PAS/PAC sensor(s) [uncultured Solirubrobacteraceae bacterium]|uniref:Diguanylate cyclase/phosphodiesterase (GGDEF & EAL domains) with PAS/PAC sensor(S) n=1 Tax=uncultured Solirubrobacteraceae bacterium TaxID=1162706 RepID=A0A6J4S1H9_9ACTN|nr:MAG: diguanylate cyclase/phosphodiesterase (GGDEF & EAL domains) with PAS/PAC sensor(s) [uncultured Solirubrobacteraceae bacterium]
MRRLSLLLRFSLLSAVLVTVLGAVLANLLAGQIERRALASAENLGKGIALAQLESFLLVSDLDGMGPVRLMEFDHRLGGNRLEYLGIERVKIFNTDATIVYSDDRATIGDSGAGSDMVRQALAGRVVSKLTYGLDHTGHGARMVEVFVPFRHPGTSGTAAVFEVYLPYAPVADQMRDDTRQLYLALGSGLAILWLALFPIVAEASKSLRRQAAENRRQARFDALTELPNRRSLQESVEHALLGLGDGRLAAFLLIDLDHFKEVNDTLGHDHGDRLLQEVATRLGELMRPTDVLARLGGDEFAVFICDVPDRDIVRRRAQEMHAALNLPVDLSSVSVVVDASIGIAMAPQDGTTMDTLLKHADVAMYAAKKTANRVCEYTPELDPYSHDRLELGGQLHEAIARGELVLHYQPLVSAADGRIRGAEALVRWQHPDRGLLPPADFLPLAERTGAIGPLTDFVIDRAIKDAADWNRRGMDVEIAVNLAGASASDPRIPDRVAAALERHGLAPDKLMLELSEDTVITDPRRVAAVLWRLDELGVRLALDDFGTGMSSLAHLRRLPLHQLKIDRSFVSRLLADTQDAGVVEAIIALAQSLSLETVAEGVEDDVIASALTARGCDQLQGYHFSRPVPGADFERWARENAGGLDGAPATGAVALTGPVRAPAA